MPSIVSHAVAGLALGVAFRPGIATRRFSVAGGVCAALPDIDALGRPFGHLGYEQVFGGHRGFTHSLLFAVLLGAAVAWGAFRGSKWDGVRLRLWTYLALATATHGVLDAFTTYGEGVALLAPFSAERFSSAWQPLGAIGPRRSAIGQLAAVIANELVWIWLPSLLFAALVLLVQRIRRSEARKSRWM